MGDKRFSANAQFRDHLIRVPISKTYGVNNSRDKQVILLRDHDYDIG